MIVLPILSPIGQLFLSIVIILLIIFTPISHNLFIYPIFIFLSSHLLYYFSFTFLSSLSHLSFNFNSSFLYSTFKMLNIPIANFLGTFISNFYFPTDPFNSFIWFINAARSVLNILLFTPALKIFDNQFSYLSQLSLLNLFSTIIFQNDTLNCFSKT